MSDHDLEIQTPQSLLSIHGSETEMYRTREVRSLLFGLGPLEFPSATTGIEC
jgi:hypothetical protein